MSQDTAVIKFGADHAGQLAAVLRWLRANGISNPAENSDPNQPVGDVVTMLLDIFPGSRSRDVGLVTRVLFGEAVNKEALMEAMSAMNLRLQFRKLKDQVQREDEVVTEELDEINSPDMAPFWAEIPEVDPPKSRSTFESWETAASAVTVAFPVLIDHPEIRTRITMVLWGDTDETTPTEFGVFVAHARAFQTQADGITGLDLVVAPGTHGGERLLSDDELDALHGQSNSHDDITLDQEDDDDPEWCPWKELGIDENVLDSVLFDNDPEDADISDTPSIPEDRPRTRRWSLMAALSLLFLVLIIYAGWSLREFRSFADDILNPVASVDQADEAAPTGESADQASASPVISLVPGASALIDPFDPEHQDSQDLQPVSSEDLALEDPLPCTDFKLLHSENNEHGSDPCHTVRCQEGHTASMKLIESVWHPCES